MEASESQPLIVGAGPVGLAAALFLARNGMRVRIIDAAARPSKYSKALAVNPRTLELLEPTGITAEMLAMGRPIRGACFWSGGRMLAELLFEHLPHKYPFMLALSQAATVRLLESALNACGVHVEWGCRLVDCLNRNAGVEATLEGEGSRARQALPCRWLLAADGARSTVRKTLGISFEGSSFQKQWNLVDVPLETSLADDRAHVLFQEGGGFIFAIRVVDGPDRRNGPAPLWRLMGNVPDLAGRMEGHAVGPPVWESSFHISHRIAGRLQEGRVFFAGDAAHIHSPVGARGMNLGIEDAWVFAQLADRNQLDRYSELRRPVDAAVVRRVDRLSRLARGESIASRTLRSTLLPILTRLPASRKRLLATVSGLDHSLNL